MTEPHRERNMEDWIAEWRSQIGSRQAKTAINADELEGRLRNHMAGLIELGLTNDEAFLVALKRIGDMDASSPEAAQVRLDRLWKQLFLTASKQAEPNRWFDLQARVAIGLAVAAAATIKMPALIGLEMEAHAPFHIRNLGLFALPFLAAYFAWKRRLAPTTIGWIGLAFVAAGLLANVAPFAPKGAQPDPLQGLHLPIALWLAVGIAHAGGRWSKVGGRMDFIRFSGELFILYVLIGLGGAVLTLLMSITFRSIGIEIGPFIGSWLLPCGGVGAVLIASWLADSRQAAVGNIAPILTRLFTPLFTLMILAFLGALLLSDRSIRIDRGLLIGFDLLLVVVLGLLLYSISARDASAPPGPFDAMQVALVVSALLANAVALACVGARIGEFGFSPNRVAALGENIILMVNLAGAAVLHARFMTGRGTFARLEKWQTDFLPIYAGWAAIVVIVFPLVFR